MGFFLHTASSLPISMRDPLNFMIERGFRNGFDIDCSTLREKILYFGSNRIGQYVPQCNDQDKTKFNTLQCHGSTGYCWCSSSDGKLKSDKFKTWEKTVSCED